MKISNKHKGKIEEYISKVVMKGELENDDLVQIIELCGSYLNLQTISNYAKKNNLSYNGVKNCRTIINIFKTKFVVDNH